MGARHLPMACLRFLVLSSLLLPLNKVEPLTTLATSSSASSSTLTSVSTQQRKTTKMRDTTPHGNASNITDSLCDSEVTLEAGQALRFHSPGFPRHYPNFSLCSWRVNAPENGELLLQCGVFRLESCWFLGDALYVSTDYFWLINRYCGESGPMTPRKAKHYFHFLFWSYYTENPTSGMLGFDCTVRAQREDDVGNPVEIESFRDCGRVNRPVFLPTALARSPRHAKKHLASSKKSFVAEFKNANSITKNSKLDGIPRTNLSMWTTTDPGRTQNTWVRVLIHKSSFGAETQDVEKHSALRIVGGEETLPHEYPWQAALILGGSLGIYPFCGASLISSKWVLTAAHCLHEAQEKGYNFEVFLGGHDTGSFLEAFSHHVRAEVKRKVIHPNFDIKTMDHDIGLLELEKRLSLSGSIRPVCLPSGPGGYSGAPATVTGWGVTADGSTLTSRVLRSVELEVLSTFRCRLSYFFYLSDNMLCARGRGKDACQGDSGGPLIVRLGDLQEEKQRRRARALERRLKGHEGGEEGKEGEEELDEEDMDRMVQIGIVSWGNGCARYSYPGVYTRIDKYLDWMKYYLGEQEVCSI